jgi:endonuclease/exonuclease/phosphatase (EEP) superfamily protein YafD
VARTLTIANWLLRFLAGWLGLAIIATYLPHWGWRFELISHFRPYFVVVLLIVGCLFGLQRHWSWLGLAALPLLLGLTSLVPFYINPSRAVADQDKVVYRVLAFNVYFRSDNYAALLDLVADSDPDIIVLTEVTADWREGLRDLMATYPYTHFVDHPLGTMLYSRYPILMAAYVVDEVRPSLTATLDLGDYHLNVVGVHAMAPMSPNQADQRNQTLDNLVQYVETHTTPLILLGDFNITPWSPIMQRFLRETRLRDGRMGYGLVPTWPSHQWLKIPIDYALVSDDISVHHFERGPRIGSDHYPILIDFWIQAE